MFCIVWLLLLLISYDVHNMIATQWILHYLKISLH